LISRSKQVLEQLRATMWIRLQSASRSYKLLEETPVKPSWRYRKAMATTHVPYNFDLVKRRRKIAKRSKKINRRK